MPTPTLVCRHASGTLTLAAGVATPAFSPLYQQIKVLMLQSLQSGEWKPSAAIPSEIELAQRFKVSQGTVRKAVDELAAENLLVRRQGKGTFVATHAERTVQYRFLKLFPDNGDPNSEGPAQRQIIDCKRLRASTDVARALAENDPHLSALAHEPRLALVSGVDGLDCLALSGIQLGNGFCIGGFF